MAKKKKTSGRGKASPITSAETHVQAFTEVVGIIREARQKAFHAVNTTLISRFENAGILKEITGRKRGKQYVYAKYLDIQSEGTKV